MVPEEADGFCLLYGQKSDFFEEGDLDVSLVILFGRERQAGACFSFTRVWRGMKFIVEFTVTETHRREVDVESKAEAIRLVKEIVNMHLRNDLTGARFSNFRIKTDDD